MFDYQKTNALTCLSCGLRSVALTGSSKNSSAGVKLGFEFPHPEKDEKSKVRLLLAFNYFLNLFYVYYNI